MSAEACDSVSSAWELMHNDSCSVICTYVDIFFSPIITDDFFFVLPDYQKMLQSNLLSTGMESFVYAYVQLLNSTSFY